MYSPHKVGGRCLSFFLARPLSRPPRPGSGGPKKNTSSGDVRTSNLAGRVFFLGFGFVGWGGVCACTNQTTHKKSMPKKYKCEKKIAAFPLN